MAARRFFTQKEVDDVKENLEKLPDLSSQRMTRKDVLEHLKETIVMLSREKGYGTEDIKSAMDAMNFNFSEKSIADIIRKEAGDKKRQTKKDKDGIV